MPHVSRPMDTENLKVKVLTNHPDREGIVEIRVQILESHLQKAKRFGAPLLRTMSPTGAVVLAFKYCIEQWGFDVDIKRKVIDD